MARVEGARRLMLPFAGLMLAAGLACGAPEGGEDPERPAETTADAPGAAREPDAEAPEPSAPPGPARSGSPSVLQLPGPEADPEPPLRRYRLRLVNRSGVQAVVYASAGAGRVLLDTLARQDSSRIDVEVRAERLRLEALDPGEETLAESEVALHPNSLTRWEVPPQP